MLPVRAVQWTYAQMVQGNVLGEGMLLVEKDCPRSAGPKK